MKNLKKVGLYAKHVLSFIIVFIIYMLAKSVKFPIWWIAVPKLKDYAERSAKDNNVLTNARSPLLADLLYLVPMAALICTNLIFGQFWMWMLLILIALIFGGFLAYVAISQRDHDEPNIND